MHDLCIFLICFCSKLVFDQIFFLFVEINLATRGPLYTCLVFIVFSACKSGCVLSLGSLGKWGNSPILQKSWRKVKGNPLRVGKSRDFFWDKQIMKNVDKTERFCFKRIDIRKQLHCIRANQRQVLEKSRNAVSKIQQTICKAIASMFFALILSYRLPISDWMFDK